MPHPPLIPMKLLLELQYHWNYYSENSNSKQVLRLQSSSQGEQQTMAVSVGVLGSVTGW